MSDAIRTRFAPSPTGHLHIGGARTALVNWLFARRSGGKFILRIEDTDRDRSTDEYIDSIMEGMRWLGLDWDEGPHRQTDRLDTYKKYIDTLLDRGMAYRCYCTAEELEERRVEAQKKGLPPRYDRRCRDLKEPVEGRTPSIRFRMPTEGTTVVEDMIKGNVAFENAQLDDLIIARSDGTPTYNFCVVVDDVDMGITHVIRGDDHLNNTPKQLHIYRALGHGTPVFGHLPMIMGSDKTRLSKRHGATSVIAYRDEGYLPDALINYLVRLGWSHGDQEVFTRKELLELFSFENVGKAAAVFNPEKLLWLNSEHIKLTAPERLTDMVIPLLIADGIINESESLDMSWLAKAVGTLTERCRTLKEMANALKYYIIDEVELDAKAREKFINAKSRPYLEGVVEALEGIEEFSAPQIEKAFMTTVERHGIKLGAVAQPVRVALTGNTVSPGIFEVIEIVGRERTLKRLRKAISLI